LQDCRIAGLKSVTPHAAKDQLVRSRFHKRVYRNQGWLSPVVIAGGITQDAETLGAFLGARCSVVFSSAGL
jgi:hypothetical protein